MATLPKIQPLTLSRRAAPFDDPDWRFELKYDGFRALLYLNYAKPRLVSRNGNAFTNHTDLAEALAGEFGNKTLILDGEIIAADEAGRPQFLDLLRQSRRASFVAFDLLWHGNRDLRSLSLTERQARLGDIVPDNSRVISQALMVDEKGCELFDLVKAHDLEGIVAKRKASAYAQRVRWYKIKNPAYTQAKGRGELFSGRAPSARSMTEPAA